VGIGVREDGVSGGEVFGEEDTDAISISDKASGQFYYAPSEIIG